MSFIDAIVYSSRGAGQTPFPAENQAAQGNAVHSRVLRAIDAMEQAREAIRDRYGIKIDSHSARVKIHETRGGLRPGEHAYVTFDARPGGTIHVNVFSGFYDRVSEQTLIHLMVHEYMHILSKSAAANLAFQAILPFANNPIFRDPGNSAEPVSFKEIFTEGGSDFHALAVRSPEAADRILEDIQRGAVGYRFHLKVYTEIVEMVGVETAENAFFRNNAASRGRMKAAAEKILNARSEYRRRSVVDTACDLRFIYGRDAFEKIAKTILGDYADTSLPRTEVMQELENRLGQEVVLQAWEYLRTPKEMRILEQYRFFEAVVDELVRMGEAARFAR